MRDSAFARELARCFEEYARKRVAKKKSRPSMSWFSTTRLPKIIPGKDKMRMAVWCNPKTAPKARMPIQYLAAVARALEVDDFTLDRLMELRLGEIEADHPAYASALWVFGFVERTTPRDILRLTKAYCALEERYSHGLAELSDQEIEDAIEEALLKSHNRVVDGFAANQVNPTERDIALTRMRRGRPRTLSGTIERSRGNATGHSRS